MAPKKGSKRSSGARPEHELPPAKRVPKDLDERIASDPRQQAVMDMIGHPLAEQMLPDMCRQMLKAMIPDSIFVEADKRHTLQIAAVDMIGEVAEDIQASMQKDVDKAESTIAEMQASRPSLEEHKQKAEGALAEAIASKEAQETVLAEVSLQLVKAKAASSEAQQALKTSELPQKTASKEKEALEVLMLTHFHPLRDTLEGEWDAATMKKHANAVLAAMGKKLSLEESLQTAAHSTLTKKPSARSEFDSIVLQQVEASFLDRIKELEAAIAEAGSEITERVAAAEVAHSNLNSLKENQQKAASELRSRQVILRNATSAATSADNAVENFLPNLEVASDSLQSKVAELNKFRTWNVKCYQELKDGAAPATCDSEQKAMEVACETPAPEPAACDTEQKPVEVVFVTAAPATCDPEQTAMEVVCETPCSGDVVAAVDMPPEQNRADLGESDMSSMPVEDESAGKLDDASVLVAEVESA